MDTQIFFVVCWILVSGSFSISWSSTINGMFSSKLISHTMAPDIVESIAIGIQKSMDQCKEQFKWNTWNCPQSTFSRQIRQPMTKEVAYARAITSAGIVYSIARNCSKGDFTTCNCATDFVSSNASFPKSLQEITNIDQHQVQKDWSWGGCSDNPSYGEIQAKLFLESFEKGSDVQAYIERHNNRIGRQIVKETMVKKCRCHGVSGSCTLQTCYLQVAPFAHISQLLQERYKKAVRLSFEQARGARMVGNSAKHSVLNKFFKVSRKSLAYLDESPNYCTENHTTGWPGTRGRVCSRSNQDSTSIEEKKSCRNLCRACGYKVRRLKKKLTSRCNCSFQWCCEVKCDICTEDVDEYFCD